MTGSDKSEGITSDESPRRSRRVANPNRWPACAQSAKLRIHENEPNQTGPIGSAQKATENDAGNQRKLNAQTAAPDDVYDPIVHGGESATTAAVVLSGRLWQEVKERTSALPLASPLLYLNG